MPTFQPKTLSIAIFTLLLGVFHTAHADSTDDDESENPPAVTPANLGTATIILQKRLHQKSEEVTGLGKTIKNIEDIHDKQILSVRDLVKDTPGVGVVEQGRGASSGYAIRGMDKNRVAVSVDGIAQIQSYLTQKRQFGDGREGSGAINEIELENISGVQISQGASGSESGSGALGGAVSFRTKSVHDVLDADKNATAFYKTAFASRDDQWLHSVGGAFRHGKLDGLVQFTDRKKHTPKPHKDIFNTQYQVWRWAGTPQDFANQTISPDSDPKRQFIIADECAGYNPDDVNTAISCAKPKLVLQPTLETIKAEDYTGDQRVLPDPMDYHSKSWLIKAGINANAQNRLEAVHENTTQRYDSRDMTKTAYHLSPARGQGNLAQSSLVYRGQNHSEGINTDAKIGLWTQAQFFDETHSKNRTGVSYHYKDSDKKGLVDDFSLAWDKQTVSIDHLQIAKYCSPYPTVDRHCQAGFDKPNSAEMQNRKIYSENHQLWRAELNKTLAGKLITHRLNAQAGLDKFRSNLWIGDVKERYYHLDFKEEKYFRNPNGGFIDVYRTEQRLDSNDVCQNAQQYLGEARKCGDRPITGKATYLALKDTMQIGDLANVSLGVRHDTHRFDSNDDWTGTGKYRNLSWHGGLVLRPIEHLDLLYRVSTAHRVPSFKELFGYRLDGIVKGENDDLHYRTNVTPEKATNHEIGASIYGDWGKVDVSYFENKYRDLIDLTLKNQQWGYRNYQNLHLSGVNLAAKIHLDQLWQKLPSGLDLTANYLRTNVKDNQINGQFDYATGYFLDAISPTRYVVSLDYANSDDTWGLGATLTKVAAKDDSELTTIALSPSGTYEKTATTVKSRGWQTLDLSAFYRPNRHLTARFGINNALNYRYSTWEALRQTSAVSGNQHTQGLASQYAASGRNFVVSLETKF